ncbi:thiol reductant ABC exporter subunit CydC [Actinotalea sp.]|uniref:thiol reductant ABC exporter subunit CydC n=1 Tax=Actinotalea sp. TaxID=1872145 RepID=UPI003567C63D
MSVPTEQTGTWLHRVRQDPLWQALAILDVDRRRVALAVLAGAAGMGSAVALAGVSAWLIARASQMPPVMYLNVAAVGVRLFGISRGLLRYVERLVSHDVALRGMVTLRVRLYELLAGRPPARLLALRRGDLLARVGADVDAVGDVLVRGLLPMAVAGVLSLGSAIAVALFLPSAGLALAGCLVLAGIVAPWWQVRASRVVEERSAQARADLAAVTVSLLDGAAELTVSGRLGLARAQLDRAQTDLASAADAGARPAAVAAALNPLATGLAVLASLVLGIPATTSGALAPVELAVVVLLPLAAFEAVGMVPNAAVAVLRSREAARRIMDLLGEDAPSTSPTDADRTGPTPSPEGEALLEASALSCGWPGSSPVLTGIDLDLGPGRRVAIVGPSGLGKTTLLLTLAGLLPPQAGEVRVHGRPVDRIPRAEAAAAVTMTAEDAHLFDTSLLENLRVARGDVSPDEAVAALRAVGLTGWLAGLPDGLATVLGSDAARVSGGERRRLLVARALLSPAPVLLLDEPTEHVDADAAGLLRDLLSGTLAPGKAIVVVTHRLAGLEAADEVILLGETGTVRARGRHDELLTTQVDGAAASGADSYRAAWAAQEQERS